MRVLVNFSEIQAIIKEVRAYKEGFITNFFLTEGKVAEIVSMGDLTYFTFDKCYFILKSNKKIYHLYYICTRVEVLKKAITKLLIKMPNTLFVIDIVGNDFVFEIRDVFTDKGFSEYTFLVRMSKIAYEPEMQLIENVNIKIAKPNESSQILALFNQFFDPKAEQIPTILDIEKWIKNEGLIIYKNQDQIAGFIVFEIRGLTSYLRYWFVHPDFRDKKIGSLLFKYYKFRGKDTKRQLFWVINTNDNAIMRYRHYGFVEEKMYNFVLTNKDIVYEG